MFLRRQEKGETRADSCYWARGGKGKLQAKRLTLGTVGSGDFVWSTEGGSHFALGQNWSNTSRLSAGHLYAWGCFLTSALAAACTHTNQRAEADGEKKDVNQAAGDEPFFHRNTNQTTARLQSSITDHWNQYDVGSKDKNKVWETQVVRSSESRTARGSCQPLCHSEACHWIKVALWFATLIKCQAALLSQYLGCQQGMNSSPLSPPRTANTWLHQSWWSKLLTHLKPEHLLQGCYFQWWNLIQTWTLNTQTLALICTLHTHPEPHHYVWQLFCSDELFSSI